MCAHTKGNPCLPLLDIRSRIRDASNEAAPDMKITGSGGCCAPLLAVEHLVHLLAGRLDGLNEHPFSETLGGALGRACEKRKPPMCDHAAVARSRLQRRTEKATSASIRRAATSVVSHAHASA